MSQSNLRSGCNFLRASLESVLDSRRTATALIADILRGLAWVNSQKVPEDLKKLVNHILIILIDSLRGSLIHCSWTAGSVCTSQVHITIDADRLVAKVGKYVSGIWTSIIVPLLCPAVYKDGVRREVFIVIDNVCEVCAGLVTSSGVRSEVLIARILV